jgi:hypothetical protein
MTRIFTTMELPGSDELQLKARESPSPVRPHSSGDIRNPGVTEPELLDHGNTMAAPFANENHGVLHDSRR